MIQFELSGRTIFSTSVGETYHIHGIDTQSTYLFGAPDASVALTYSIRSDPNAEDPFPIADVLAPLSVSELNGENLLTGVGADAAIFDLNWVDQTGASRSTTVLYFFKSSSNATGFEGLQQESFFYLAGAELDFASIAEVQKFSDSITSVTAGSGVYGPDRAISIFELVDDNPFVTPIGTEGADSLVGNRFDNEIQGLSGNDTMFGGGGDDELGGGFGNDVLRGGGWLRFAAWRRR